MNAAMAVSSVLFTSLSPLQPLRIEVKAANLPSLRCSTRSQFFLINQDVSNSQNDGRGRRRVWRRRKLAKKDEMEYKLQRIPFLEEQVRKVREGGKLLSMDIERLLLSEDNRFDFVNEVAAEAKQYVENNRDEYGGKKAILHVLSNRMNDAGFYRPEAYMEDDPYKPGPNYLREEL
ncbi:hypothetical protein CsSME_00002038 [Camellia sinensis var. sinensis]|uniref:protein PLASTID TRANSCRIPTIONALLY ACTIVE 7 isoform X1 n=1 Tax=Camellia sinensis TaxID=4442 RepID=UPI0010359782|nr:protein PLASTID TRANSCRIPTIONALLY ACTIVE 7 isoform X1 [Camellia sinensis]